MKGGYLYSVRLQFARSLVRTLEVEILRRGKAAPQDETAQSGWGLRVAL